VAEVLEIEARGAEISRFAIKTSLIPGRISQEDITDMLINPANSWDLAIAYDLLEHIKYEDLGKAIEEIIKAAKKHILISVPVIGDPNLELDPTHIIKETKEWWTKQFTDKGCKLIPTPDHFLFKKQILIFEVLHET